MEGFVSGEGSKDNDKAAFSNSKSELLEISDNYEEWISLLVRNEQEEY